MSASLGDGEKLLFVANGVVQYKAEFSLQANAFDKLALTCLCLVLALPGLPTLLLYSIGCTLTESLGLRVSAPVLSHNTHSNTGYVPQQTSLDSLRGHDVQRKLSSMGRAALLQVSRSFRLLLRGVGTGTDPTVLGKSSSGYL